MKLLQRLCSNFNLAFFKNNNYPVVCKHGGGFYFVYIFVKNVVEYECMNIITPKISIKDNWGWYNGGTSWNKKGNGTEFSGSIVVKEE